MKEYRIVCDREYTEDGETWVIEGIYPIFLGSSRNIKNDSDALAELERIKRLAKKCEEIENPYNPNEQIRQYNFKVLVREVSEWEEMKGEG